MPIFSTGLIKEFPSSLKGIKLNGHIDPLTSPGFSFEHLESHISIKWWLAWKKTYGLIQSSCHIITSPPCEERGQSLMSRSIIIRGLINELHEDRIITQSEKELLNDWKAPAPPKQSPKLTLLWSRHQKVDWGKECRTQTLSEQTHRVMPSEVFAWDENVELRNIGLSQQVWDQLHSIRRQKEASPLETLEMTLRQHFGISAP